MAGAAQVAAGGAREEAPAGGSSEGGRGAQAAPGSIGAFVRSCFQQVGMPTNAC